VNLISTRYAFTSAYLKGEEARGMMSGHIEAVVQRGRAFQDVVDIIKETDLGEYLIEYAPSGWTTFEEMDRFLGSYLDNCLDRLRRFKLPGDMVAMMDAYTPKFDILNMKIALRGVLMDESSYPLMPVGELAKQDYLEAMTNAATAEELSDFLVKINMGDYAVIVNGVKEKDYRSTVEAEFNLDHLYVRTMRDTLTHMSDGNILTKAWGIMIDLANLDTVFRSVLGTKGLSGEMIFDGGHMLTGDVVRELYSLKIGEIAARLEHTEYETIAQDIAKTYEKEGNVTAVDRVMEKHKTRLLGDLLSPRALSPCNLLWYLEVKELEIRNARLIFKALMDGVPLSEIRDYLVTAS
jgi:vacuolar-type H+-ATPase subunit C/Vma6